VRIILVEKFINKNTRETRVARPKIIIPSIFPVNEVKNIPMKKPPKIITDHKNIIITPNV
jgi:hypothetical protein